MPLDTTTVSHDFWQRKYQLVGFDGVPIDTSISETWRRVATALAQPETEPEFWATQFYDIMDDFKFIPAGRILSGAGAGRQMTLFNCYVMGAIDDSMGGIFSALREAALTLREGGGVGMDFSTIRPAGTLVRGVGAKARGPIYFMDCWDTMSATMHDAHDRVGAMMATLRCDHPDIFDFISAKRTRGRLTGFNLSVLITDKFMDAVHANGSWDLVFGGQHFRTVSATELWEAIMQATYAYAEPGVIFIDRINRENNLWYIEEISATNPCGEVPLPPYSQCLLGSLNLSRFVRNPFTAAATFDKRALRNVVPTAVRLLDNVNDVSRCPLPQQKEMALQKRRLGMGVTGLGDALAMMGIRYGSKEAVAWTEYTMGLIETTAYMSSAALAKEKSPFPLFDREKYMEGHRFKQLPREVQVAIADNGIRNSHLMAVAPTGTISLFAGNVSSGIEPIFKFKYPRKIRQPDHSYREEDMQDYAYSLFCEVHPNKDPREFGFIEAHEVPWQEHVRMLAAVQRHVDNSVSKTINLSADIPYDEFKEVYAEADRLGCKSCTTYRPNDITGSILGGEPEKAEPTNGLRERGDDLPGFTYRRRWNGESLYITINDEIKPDGRRVPFEIFFRSKSMENDHWARALTRLMSSVMRRDADFRFLVSDLRQVWSAQGEWVNGRYVSSVVALVGDVLHHHFVRVGYMSDEPTIASSDVGRVATVALPPGSECPSCHQPAVVREDNCSTCKSCGWSRCA